jgi:RNA polymerase sigma-70 factor, ECF subfamily
MGTASAHASIFTEHAKTLIRIKARQLCRRHGFTSSDEDDIQQELWLRLTAKAHYFDPARGSLHAFVERVVCSGVCGILRHRRRQRRAPSFRAISLESTMVEVDGIPSPIGRAISPDDLHRRIGTHPADDLSCRQQVDTLDHALGSMSPSLRNICQRLTSGSAHSTARDLKTSRRQVRNAIRAIRRHLERAGF